MSGTGYYDGTSVRVDIPLKINQRVLVIPIETEIDLEESAAGGLHRYANPSLTAQEKDVWREAVVRKHAQE